MRTWTLIDKTIWPERGPWDSEPDKAEWIDESTGLDCLMVRARSHWCGYVGIPESHPAFGKHYDDVAVDVHGGLTFSDKCQAGEGELRICHTPEPGRTEHLWWLGFDCAHSGDKRPCTTEAVFRIEQEYLGSHYEGGYRSFDYVKSETESLAKQLRAMEIK